MIGFKPLVSNEEWEWMRERTHAIGCADTQGIMAYEGMKILAGAVFDNWTDDSCQMHIAIDNPKVLTNNFFQEVCRHVFTVCGRTRIFGLVPSNNKRCSALWKDAGMVEVAVVPHGIGTGIDCIIVCLEKEDCKWLELEEEAA